MAQPAVPCFCTDGRETPRTLDGLRGLSDVTLLDGGLDTLALVGTQLTEAVMTTNNGAALLSGVGGYSALQTSAMPHRLSRSRVTLRVAPHVPVRLAKTPPDDDRRVALVVADDHGDISHRIETRGRYDTQVLNAIDPGDAMIHAPLAESLAEDVVPLTAVRSARATWDECDTGNHLNDLFADRGRIRCAVLPHIGRNKAWQIAKQSLIGFLGFLNDRRIGHARLVPGTGFIQGDLALAGHLRQAGQILLMSGGGKSFAIDLDQITSMWVTRFGPMSQVEIYGRDDHAITVIAADPNEDFNCWNALLASLPPVSWKLRTH